MIHYRPSFAQLRVDRNWHLVSSSTHHCIAPDSRPWVNYNYGRFPGLRPPSYKGRVLWAHLTVSSSIISIWRDQCGDLVSRGSKSLFGCRPTPKWLCLRRGCCDGKPLRTSLQPTGNTKSFCRAPCHLHLHRFPSHFFITSCLEAANRVASSLVLVQLVVRHLFKVQLSTIEHDLFLHSFDLEVKFSCVNILRIYHFNYVLQV